MAPRHEKFLQRVGEIFLMTLLEFALVSENAIKKYCLGVTTLLEFALVSEKAIKKILPCGGGGNPPPGGPPLPRSITRQK